MNGVLTKETEIGEVLKVAFRQEDNKVFVIVKNYTEMTKRTIEIAYWQKFVTAVNHFNDVLNIVPQKKINSFDKKKWEREYYQKNKEKIAKRMAKYYQKNKERISGRNIQWQKDNPEKVNKNRRESSRRYYEKYPEKVKAANKRYQEAHPEYRKEYCEKHRAEVNEYSKEWNKRKRKKLAMLAYQNK